MNCHLDKKKFNVFLDEDQRNEFSIFSHYFHLFEACLTSLVINKFIFYYYYLSIK